MTSLHPIYNENNTICKAPHYHGDWYMRIMQQSAMWVRSHCKQVHDLPHKCCATTTALYHDSSLKRSGTERVNKGSQFYLMPTFIHKWNEPCLSLLPSCTASPHFWLVLISHPTGGRRLSWPGWLGEILMWFAWRRWSPISVLTGPNVE